MLRISVVDRRTKTPADVDKYHRAQRIIEYAHEFKIPLSQYLINGSNSSNLAINASLDSSTNIWNGTGVNDTGADWTISSSSNATIVESSESKYSGTNGLDVSMPNKQYIRFESSNTDVSSATVFQFWIQPKQGWDTDGSLKIKLRLDGSSKGKSVNILDYMSGQAIDVWQQVSIPLDDFDSGVIGYIDYIKLKASKTKNFWFDDFKFGTSGVSGTSIDDIRFVSVLKPNVRYYVTGINFTIVDDSETGPSAWDGDKFGNVNSLSSSIILKYIHDNKIILTWPFKNNSDFIERCSNIRSQIGLTKTVASYIMTFEPLVFKSSLLNRFEVDVTDDLSGLDKLSIALIGYTISDEYFTHDRDYIC